MAETIGAGSVRGGGRLVMPRVPRHVVTLIGLSTSGYAISLAAVAGLQAGAESTLRTDQAPVVAGIANVASTNDRLADDLAGISGAASEAGGAYRTVVDGVSALEASIGRLSAVVADVDGAARALPARVALPPVIRTVNPVTRPTVHATTGGSGAP
jgi:hypothetical protein